MSGIIAWFLIFIYILTDKPEMIIGAGLFGIAAEIYALKVKESVEWKWSLMQTLQGGSENILVMK